MLWLPVRVIRRLMPTFLPYNAVLNNDAVMSELSLELLLLQVVLPALLEQGHIRAWLKSVVRGWTIGMAWVLDLRSYLIGDIPLSDQVMLSLKIFICFLFFFVFSEQITVFILIIVVSLHFFLPFL